MSFDKELTTELSKVVARLNAVDEHAWRLFMGLLSRRVEHVTEAMVNAPAQEVQIRQGRAQEVRDLMKVLDGGVDFARQLHAKEKTNGRASYPALP